GAAAQRAVPHGDHAVCPSPSPLPAGGEREFGVSFRPNAQGGKVRRIPRSPSLLWRNTLRSSALRESVEGDSMSDTQRTAIVTGAAGGIGRALVKGMLGAGIHVAAVDRTPDGLAAVTAAAREQGREANLLTIEADLSRETAIADIVGQAR